MKKCGFVAIIGLPNAGKSTLLNQLVGEKVSIVCHKAQTTRFRVTGIVTDETTQLIMVDTPGIFQPSRRLDRSMVSAAWSAALDADEIILLVDACKEKTFETLKPIIEKLQKFKKKVVLALNKIDLIERSYLLALAQNFMDSGVIHDVFMISAKNGDGIQDLKNHLMNRMPNGPWLYPDDQLSDLPMRVLAAELTREQIFYQLHEELPYNMTVRTDTWEPFKNGSIKIIQTIYVSRPQHRAIVIGNKGETVKRIGMAARKEMEAFFGTRIHLVLQVTIDEKWQEKPSFYEETGLEFKV